MTNCRDDTRTAGPLSGRAASRVIHHLNSFRHVRFCHRTDFGLGPPYREDRRQLGRGHMGVRWPGPRLSPKAGSYASTPGAWHKPRPNFTTFGTPRRSRSASQILGCNCSAYGHVHRAAAGARWRPGRTSVLAHRAVVRAGECWGGRRRPSSSARTPCTRPSHWRGTTRKVPPGQCVSWGEQLRERALASGADQLGDPLGHLGGDLAEFRERRLQLGRDGVIRVRVAGGAGDMRSQVTPPLDLVRAIHRSQDTAQITRDRGLQRRQRVRVVFTPRPATILGGYRSSPHLACGQGHG